MESFLTREFSRIRRNNGLTGLVLLDVDHVKSFNDTFGHQAGDAVLMQLAQLLERKVRKGDIACRFGGEEFLLIRNDASLQQTLARAEDIRIAVEQRPFMCNEGRPLGPVAISLGVAELPGHGDTVDKAFQTVDAARYAAKGQGRNKVASACWQRLTHEPGRCCPEAPSHV